MEFLSQNTNARKFFLRVIPLEEDSSEGAVRIVMATLAGQFTEFSQLIAATRRENQKYAVPKELLNSITDLLMTVYGGTRRHWNDKFRWWRANVSQPKRIASYFAKYSILKKHREHWATQYELALVNHSKAKKDKNLKKTFKLEYPPEWNDHLFLQIELPSSDDVELTLQVAPPDWNHKSNEIPVRGELPDMDQYRRMLQRVLQRQSPLHPQPDFIPGSPQSVMNTGNNDEEDDEDEEEQSTQETGEVEEKSPDVDTEKTTSSFQSSDK